MRPSPSVVVLVLEGHFELGAIGLHLAVLDHQVLLNDLGDAQVPRLIAARSMAAAAALSQDFELVPMSSMTL